MANFTQAYNLTSAHEGGYVNDALDRGGETYRGISRVYHSSWNGWSKNEDRRALEAYALSRWADHRSLWAEFDI